MNKNLSKTASQSVVNKFTSIVCIVFGILIISSFFYFTYSSGSPIDLNTDLTKGPPPTQLKKWQEIKKVYSDYRIRISASPEQTTFFNILENDAELFKRSEVISNDRRDEFQMIQLQDLQLSNARLAFPLQSYLRNWGDFTCNSPMYPCYLIFKKNGSTKDIKILPLPYYSSPYTHGVFKGEDFVLHMEKQVERDYTGQIDSSDMICNPPHRESMVAFNIPSETFSRELIVSCEGHPLGLYHSFVFQAGTIGIELRLDRFQTDLNDNGFVDVEVRIVNYQLFHTELAQLVTTLKHIPVENCIGMGCTRFAMNFKELLKESLETWNVQKETYGEIHFQIGDTHYIINTETAKISKEKISLPAEDT